MPATPSSASCWPADLGLRVGDKLRLDGGQGRESVVNVAGIFELGVRELDARYVYLDMKQAQSLLDLPGAVTVIDVTVDDIFAAQHSGRAHRPPHRPEGRKLDGDQRPADERAALAEPVHADDQRVRGAERWRFGIASVLSVSVVQRTREIGILRAMGTTRQQMLRVFLVQGALFGLAGSAGGRRWRATAWWARSTPSGPGCSTSRWTRGCWWPLAAGHGDRHRCRRPCRRAAPPRLDPVVAIRHV